MTREELQQVRAALAPFAHFAEKWGQKPLKGMADCFYRIHAGTEWEAELNLSDCQAAANQLAILNAEHGILSTRVWRRRNRQRVRRTSGTTPRRSPRISASSAKSGTSGTGEGTSDEQSPRQNLSLPLCQISPQNANKRPNVGEGEVPKILG